MTRPFIEWLGTTHFSFLEGVSSPEELVDTAHALGYAGLGVADRMGLYGVVRAFAALEPIFRRDDMQKKFFFAPGIRLHFESADPIFIYPLHRKSYGDLCHFLSSWSLEGMACSEKGLTPLPWARFLKFLRQFASLKDDFILISVSGAFYPWVEVPKESERSRLRAQEAQPVGLSLSRPPNINPYSPFWLLELAQLCGAGADSALSLAYPLTFSPGCEDLQNWLRTQSKILRVPLVATSLPLYSKKIDQDLCDLAAAIRHTRKIHDLGFLRQANGERRLLFPQERNMIYEKFFSGRNLSTAQAFVVDPFDRTHQLASRHRFSLSELNYKYPQENIPAGLTASAWLRNLAFQGAQDRYAGIIPADVHKQLEHELKLVEALQYEDYFLTIWDVLKYAREKTILFQGRGSAANSTLCYCLGITAIDPVRMGLLFERFMSMERKEPPDIDVDFEHERREEVMQEVYSRYGRRRAAMVATVICFRSRMAMRESAKALGISSEIIDEIISYMGREGLSRALEKTEFPGVPKTLWQRLLNLAPRLVGKPRHVGLHTGGFVLSHEFLDEMCILEPARKAHRSVIPWDKDDVDYLRWMKVDLLSLGMLTAIRKSFDLVGQRHEGKTPLSLATVPAECKKVYKALQRADTVGVFQIESRAQMNMLPRLAPQKFYDLVVEVAIVRPGPLQGGMVHPYLRRKQGLEPVSYDHPKLIPILEKTLGIPIFQEQVMKMAVAIAGFTPGEADQLRKVMSGAWRSRSHMHHLKEKLFLGMKQSGLSAEFAEKVYKQIEGFGEYGFPESHAASFAILTYVSSWLKVHYPAEFLCALLNSQPMGFYTPRALVADAKRHGVAILPVDITLSRWDSRLEFLGAQVSGVRLGFRLVKGLARQEASLIENLQDRGLLSSEHDTVLSPQQLHAEGLSFRALELLLRAQAMRLGEVDDRRQKLWQWYRDRKSQANSLLLKELHARENSQIAKNYTEWESVLHDHKAVGLSALSSGEIRHPTKWARENYFKNQESWVRAEDVYRAPTKSKLKVVGLISCKQRPPTAGGLCFLTLEDETGFMNLVLMPDIYEKFRLVFDKALLLAAYTQVERSLQRDATDPRTAAVSLRVFELWNPFLKITSENAKLKTWANPVRAYV
jgi:DNA-directed DNA polymerase III PolC